MKYALLLLLLLTACGPETDPEASDTSSLRNVPPGDPNEPDPILECMGNMAGSIWFSQSTRNFQEYATLNWSVTRPAGCLAVRVQLDGFDVASSGSRTFLAYASDSYVLSVHYGTANRMLGRALLTVTLPDVVPIYGNGMKLTLLQALRSPGKTIVLEDNVDLDLSELQGVTLEWIPIAAGVTLKGHRSSLVPGGRIYTTRRPTTFLEIQGDNVHITGIRLEGPQLGVGYDDDNERGILVPAGVHAEIDNCELSGWSWAAIQVNFNGATNGFLSPQNVLVHDNYIHHNQHYEQNGYGVAMSHGGYAQIERNVFDYNRHAVTGEDGSDGSGFVAYDNLVLSHGGLQTNYPVFGWSHTQQFDMHGQETCGLKDLYSDAGFNCGTAGESMYIRRNTFFYTEDASFKLRGHPQLQPVGVFIDDNVFKSWESDAIQYTADAQHQPLGTGNVFGVDAAATLGHCDFDGDGVSDDFMATGQGWWFASGGQMPWTFLRASKKHVEQLQLGFFDSDNRCDVKDGSTVYSGGRM